MQVVTDLGKRNGCYTLYKNLKNINLNYHYWKQQKEKMVKLAEAVMDQGKKGTQ